MTIIRIKRSDVQAAQSRRKNAEIKASGYLKSLETPDNRGFYLNQNKGVLL